MAAGFIALENDNRNLVASVILVLFCMANEHFSRYFLCLSEAVRLQTSDTPASANKSSALSEEKAPVQGRIHGESIAQSSESAQDCDLVQGYVHAKMVAAVGKKDAQIIQLQADLHRVVQCASRHSV
jgi:hypothetical protein